jgi:hypothetical protein
VSFKQKHAAAVRLRDVGSCGDYHSEYCIDRTFRVGCADWIPNRFKIRHVRSSIRSRMRRRIPGRTGSDRLKPNCIIVFRALFPLRATRVKLAPVSGTIFDRAVVPDVCRISASPSDSAIVGATASRSALNSGGTVRLRLRALDEAE